MTASVGVAWNGLGQLEPRHLMQDADRALYEAKTAGRNTWRSAQDWKSTTALTSTQPGGHDMSVPIV